MNILYLLGNGFDLNFGLKTSYTDFYKYYKTIPSRNKVIQGLKAEIDLNTPNWSDLELALGQHTENLKYEKEFNTVFEDLEDNLAEYLQKQEEKFTVNSKTGKDLLKRLASPQNYMEPSDKNLINVFIAGAGNTNHNIRVITYNYTRILEKLVEYNDKKIVIEGVTTKPSVLQSIDHIHGFHDLRMVLGVNDVSQIANKKFGDNKNVINNLVKSECNKAQKHTIDDLCKKRINEANLICIFGSSIGLTDKLWWQLIGNHLKKKVMLIIFQRSNSLSPLRPQFQSTLETSFKQEFFEKAGFDNKQSEPLADKVIVPINSKIFSFDNTNQDS